MFIIWNGLHDESVRWMLKLNFRLIISRIFKIKLDYKANTCCSAVAQLLVSQSLHVVKADVEV